VRTRTKCIDVGVEVSTARDAHQDEDDDDDELWSVQASERGSTCTRRSTSSSPM